MSQNQKPSALAEAATELEAALQKFDDVTNSVCRMELNSEKNLTRAVRIFNDALASREQIALALNALSQRILDAQARQQTTADRLLARGEDLKQRATDFEGLMDQVRELGELAVGVNTSFTEAAGLPDGDARKAELMLEVESRTNVIVEKARELERRANDIDMQDLARQANSLRQKLEAARNKFVNDKKN